MNVWYKYNKSVVKSLQLIFIVFIFCKQSYSQTIDCEKDNSLYGTEVQGQNLKVNTFNYSESPDYTGAMVKTGADIYQWTNNWSVSELKTRPLVILYHGGGFKQGSRKAALLQQMSSYFAQRGYLAVNADYRLGWENSDASVLCGGGNEQDYLDAQYRAMQDHYALLHFLRQQSGTLLFDPEKIFVYGFSSGAILALASTDTTLIDISGERHQRLGALNPYPPVKIRGILSVAGAQMSSKPSSDIVPTAFFHGTCDNAVFYEEGRVASCANYAYYYGPEIIRKAWQEKNVRYELHYFCGFGHDFLPEGQGSTASKGLEYILENCALFMKDELCNKEISAEIRANDILKLSSATTCNPINSFQRCGDILPLQNDIIEITPGTLYLLNQLRVYSNLTVTENAVLEIVGIDGKKIFSMPLVVESGPRFQQIDIPSFPAGIYVARVITSSGKQVVNKFRRTIQQP